MKEPKKEPETLGPLGHRAPSYGPLCFQGALDALHGLATDSNGYEMEEAMDALQLLADECYRYKIELARAKAIAERSGWSSDSMSFCEWVASKAVPAKEACR